MTVDVWFNSMSLVNKGKVYGRLAFGFFVHGYQWWWFSQLDWICFLNLWCGFCVEDQVRVCDLYVMKWSEKQMNILQKRVRHEVLRPNYYPHKWWSLHGWRVIIVPSNWGIIKVKSIIYGNGSMKEMMNMRSYIRNIGLVKISDIDILSLSNAEHGGADSWKYKRAACIYYRNLRSGHAFTITPVMEDKAGM